MIKEELVYIELPYENDRKKLVCVFVPEHEEGERFPVIYMSDGQNLFDDTKVKFGCWYVREAVRAERERSGRAAVIVGIFNGGNDIERAHDLTPAGIGAINYPKDMPEAVRKMMIPAGEVFADFVVNTVKPEIEARFPVLTGRENTAFCGSSSGGLQSLFAVLSYPEIYGAGGVFSPVPLCVLYDGREADRWLTETVRGISEKPYIYLYSGGEEGMEKEIMTGTEHTYDLIKDIYPAEQIKKVIVPENPHNEKAWAAVFVDFLHIFLS